MAGSFAAVLLFFRLLAKRSTPPSAPVSFPGAVFESRIPDSLQVVGSSRLTPSLQVPAGKRLLQDGAC